MSFIFKFFKYLLLFLNLNYFLKLSLNIIFKSLSNGPVIPNSCFANFPFRWVSLLIFAISGFISSCVFFVSICLFVLVKATCALSYRGTSTLSRLHLPEL